MSTGGIWRELGIEPTDDERAIKRAYATRLKTDRADRDTPRFIALREAYEAALGLARQRPADRVPAVGPPPEVLPADDTPVPLLTPPPPPPTAEPPAPPPLRRDTGDAARQAKPRAPEDRIRPLLEALHEGVRTGAAADMLQARLAPVLAHRDVHRFNSRDAVEGELVELVTAFPQACTPLLKTLCDEFGWAQDDVTLMRRFPNHAAALLAMLHPPPDPPAPPIRPPMPTAPPKTVFGKTEAGWMTAPPWLRWWVLVWWHHGRDVIAALVADPARCPGVPPSTRRWWLVALRWVPPVHPLLSLVVASIGGFASLRHLPLAPSVDPTHFFIGQTAAVAAMVMLAWLVVSVPWRLLTTSGLRHATAWPWAAGLVWLAAVSWRHDPDTLPAAIGAMVLLTLASTLRHIRGSVFAAVVLNASIVMLVALIGLDAANAGPSDVRRLTLALLPFVILTVLSEQALRPTPLPSTTRAAAAGLPAYIVMAICLMSSHPAAAPVAVFWGLLAGHRVWPIFSPAWIDRLASVGWIARRLPHAQVGLRLMNLAALTLPGMWLIHKGFGSPDALSAAAGLLVLRAVAFATVLPEANRPRA